MRMFSMFLLLLAFYSLILVNNSIANNEIDEELKYKHIDYLETAIDNARVGNYSRARRFFNRVVNKFDEKILDAKDYRAAFIGIAEVHRLLGQKKQALEILLTLLSEEPPSNEFISENAEVYYSYAKILKYYGLYQKAEEQINIVINFVKNKEKYFALAGEISYGQGNHTDAKNHFNEVFNIADKNRAWLESVKRDERNEEISAAYLAIAKAKYFLEFIERRSYLAEAFDNVRKALRADRFSIEAYYWAGKITLETETQIDAREMYLLKGKGINPYHPETSLELVRTYMFEWNLYEAAVEAQAIYDVVPRTTEALLAIAELSNLEQDYKSAEKYLNKLLEINPSHLYGLSLKALNCLQLGDAEGYKKFEQKAFEINPKFTDFYVHIVKGLTNNHRFAEAIEIGEKALKLEENNWHLCKQLGFAYARQGLDENRAHELLKAANSNDTLRNKLYTLNILQALRIIREEFKEIPSRDGNFIFKMPEHAVDLMLPYFDYAFRTDFADLQKKYSFTPETPIIVEAFHRADDFSARSLGVPNLPASGVSFGRLITMLLPSAMNQGTYNWRKVARHELDHIFQIQMSKGRVPRWLAEGCSVYEQRRFRADWDEKEYFELITRCEQGMLFNVLNINRAFGNMQTVKYTYFQASWFVQFIVEELGGFDTIKKMLENYAQDKHCEQIFADVLDLTIEQFDMLFSQYIHHKLCKNIKFLPRLSIVQFQKLLIEYEDKVIHSEINGKLAWGAYWNNMKSEAQKYAQDALGQDAENGYALYVLGLLAAEHSANNIHITARAIDYLAKSVVAGIEDFYLYLLLGRLYLADEPDKAEEFFKLSVEAFPQWTGANNAYQFLVQIAQTKENNEEMVEILRKLCSMDSMQIQGVLYLAKFEYDNQNYEQAFYWFRAVMDLIPHMDNVQNFITNLHSNFAFVLETLEKWEETAIEWQAAITFETLDFRKADYFYNAARAYFQAGIYAPALELINKSIVLADSDQARTLRLRIETALKK